MTENPPQPPTRRLSDHEDATVKDLAGRILEEGVKLVIAGTLVTAAFVLGATFILWLGDAVGLW